MTALKGSEIGEGLVPFFESLVDIARESPGKLTQWERDFVADVGQRFEEQRERFRCSEKQWDILRRIGNKLGVEP